MKAPDWDKILEHWPAKVLALGAALLLFLFNRFDALQIKTLTIPLRLVTDTSIVPAENFSHRVKVTLRGSEEVLSGVSEEDIEALADFSSHQAEGSFRSPIQLIRRGALAEADTLDLSVEPLELRLTLEKRRIKTVAIQPNFAGQPGKNFELSGYKIVPSIITLEGPRSVVDQLTAVHTEAIDLRGKTDSFVLKAKVESDSPLVSFPYGSVVEIQGLMTSSLATLELANVAPAVVNLNPGLSLQTPLPPVKVRLRGTPEALATLDSAATGAPVIVLVADLNGYTIPGEIPSLQLKAILPPGVELIELVPAAVSIFLETKP